MGIDVLLSGSMGDLAQTVRASLESHGLTVAEAPVPQNIFRDEFGYRRAIFHALERGIPKMIIPIGCQTALSRAKSEIPSMIGRIYGATEETPLIPVESEGKIRSLDSKVECSSLVAGLDIVQPHIFNGAPDADDAYPLVFKRDISFGGQGVHVPKSRQALCNLIDHQSPGEPYLIEEYIEGDDYSVDAFRWNGCFKGICYRTETKHWTGPSQSRTVVECPDLVASLRKILDSIDYKGVCGADFRVGKDGRAYFLECNPRFTGGLKTSIEAGLDLPWLLWDSAISEKQCQQ